MITLKANAGVAGALNAGLVQCKGEYIARMDSDDIAYPDRLASAMHQVYEPMRFY